MSTKAKPRAQVSGVRFRPTLAALFIATTPALAGAAWQTVVSEPGKRVEIDRQSIVANPAGGMTAVGRIVIDRPIVDPKTSAAYRIIEVSNHYDCVERKHATFKRSYYREEGELLRQEEVKNPLAMPVRSGTPDDRLLREVCRPKPGAPAVAAASRLAERVGQAAGELRRANEVLVDKELGREKRAASAAAPAPTFSSALVGARTSRPAARAPASRSADTPWAYAGPGGPDNWSQLKAEYAQCGAGRRQSPIDLRDGFAVDLEPIEFAYRPAPFRVVDSGRTLQMAVYGGSLSLLGKKYELARIVFHRPAETAVGGKTLAMDAQLVHQAGDGKLLILAIGLEPGLENPLLQVALNNLPLEPGGDVQPPTRSINVSSLLPEDRRYFTFMGSLTSPPCTEGVVWAVMKQPQQISVEQLAIFERLYPANARPLQPTFGRIIKESR